MRKVDDFFGPPYKDKKSYKEKSKSHKKKKNLKGKPKFLKGENQAGVLLAFGWLTIVMGEKRMFKGDREEES